MGLQTNKYHISDDGETYRINEDGSFTYVGNIEDIGKTPSSTPIDKMLHLSTQTVKTSSAPGIGWWIRNYNWLWATTLVVFIEWFISCPILMDRHYIIDLYIIDLYFVSAIVIVCFCLSWYLSKKDRTILKLAQILLVGGSSSKVYVLVHDYMCDDQRYFILLGYITATIPFLIWTVTVYLSIFSRRS